MKKRLFIHLLLILAVLITLTGCESGAKIRVINRTSYPVHATVEKQQPIIIPGNSEHTFGIDTDTQTFFSGEVREQLWLKLIGETFAIYDHENEVYVDSTQVTVKAGKTLNAFIDANRASIKVVNDSDLNIIRAEVYKNFGTYDQISGIMQNIHPGEERFMRVNYATPTTQFSYRVVVVDENNVPHFYGNNQTVLAVGQQFLVIFTGGK